MTIESIAAVGSVPMEALEAAAAPDLASTAYDSVMNGLQELNARMVSGQESVTKLALGEADNLHQIMIEGEQTRLTFELMLSVRNKVLEAYQEMMRMQV